MTTIEERKYNELLKDYKNIWNSLNGSNEFTQKEDSRRLFIYVGNWVHNNSLSGEVCVIDGRYYVKNIERDYEYNTETLDDFMNGTMDTAYGIKNLGNVNVYRGNKYT